MYHVSSDVLGVLIARVSGQSLGTFMRERIFDPLGMRDTAFHVPAEKIERLPGSYRFNHRRTHWTSFDGVAEQRMATRPAVRIGRRRAGLDARRLFCLQPHDAEQRPARPRANYFPRHGGADDFRSTHARATRGRRNLFRRYSQLGFRNGGGHQRHEIFHTPGRFGWTGGFGTTAYIDPAEGMIGILFTQRMMESPEPPKVFTDFWTLAYGAME